MKTVYLLGAGINRFLKFPHEIESPLANDFFQQLSKLIKCVRAEQRQHDFRSYPSRYADRNYGSDYLEIVDYIEKFFNVGLEELMSKSVNIEEVLTLLESQINDNFISTDIKNYTENVNKLIGKVKKEHYEKVHEKFLFVIRSFLQLLDIRLILGLEPHKLHDILKQENYITAKSFGKKILEQSANIITFNYDIVVEQCIEYAFSDGKELYSSEERKEIGKFYSKYSKSLVQEGSIPEIMKSLRHFERYKSYGFQSDICDVSIPLDKSLGLPIEHYFKISGKEFKLYEDGEFPLIFKLHGSINWEETEKKEIYFSEPHDAVFNVPWPGTGILNNNNTNAYSKVRKPILQYPYLYKKYESYPFFKTIWNKAKDQLYQANCLVIGGYSFPPTDFMAKKLFMEAFAENKSLQELVVINPDKSVNHKAKELTRFSGNVKSYDTLEDYLNDTI